MRRAESATEFHSKKSAHCAGWEECAWNVEESTVVAAGWAPDLAGSTLKIFRLPV